MKKKILALLMSLALVVALLPTAAMAVSYSDVNGHWAQSPIERWSDYEVVQGYDGKFAPNGYMTRAQAAAVFTRLLKLNKKADLSVFSDVGQGAWYDEEIAKCVGAGIMNGVSATKMDPNGTITREMFFVMFARAMGIDGKSTLNKPMADSAKVSSWAKGAVNALINAGYVSGITEDTIAPALDINRASVMALLDKTISTYATESGVTVEAKGNGVTLVVADNVTVVGSSNDALIVVAKENANVSLKGYKGVPTINVVADKVVIKDAPVSTEINTTANVTAIVNGYQMSKDDQHIVPGTPAVSGGGGSGGSSCKHENTTVTYTKGKKVEICDNKCGYEITVPAVEVTTVTAGTETYAAVYADASFYVATPKTPFNPGTITVTTATTGANMMIGETEVTVPQRSFTRTTDKINDDTANLIATTAMWSNLLDGEGFTQADFTGTTVKTMVDVRTESGTVSKEITYAIKNVGTGLYGEPDEDCDPADLLYVLKAAKANMAYVRTTAEPDGATAGFLSLRDGASEIKDKEGVTVTRNTTRRQVFDQMTQDPAGAGTGVNIFAENIIVNMGGKPYHSYGFKVSSDCNDVDVTAFSDIWNYAGGAEMGSQMTTNDLIASLKKQARAFLSEIDGEVITVTVELYNAPSKPV